MSQNKINELKKEFTLVVIIKNDINELFTILHIRIKKLKDIYDELIKTNKHCIFGLDSFKFQSKIMDLECEDLCRMYKIISNKMYCEYYKLYKMIVNYVEINIKDTKLLCLMKVGDFPVYKDLEPFREYDFIIIQNIHETILTILIGINDLVLNNKEEIKLLKNKKDFGFNIDNFINSFQYNVDIITQQIKLFTDYVSFFHKIHLKYLRRIHLKLRLFSDQINTDIRFDDTENCDYNYEIDKSTIESVKSMIYDEDFEMDNFLHIINEIDSVSNDGIVYENIRVEVKDIVPTEISTELTDISEPKCVNEFENKVKVDVENKVEVDVVDIVENKVEVDIEDGEVDVENKVEVEVELQDECDDKSEVDCEVKAECVNSDPLKKKRGRPRKSL